MDKRLTLRDPDQLPLWDSSVAPVGRDGAGRARASCRKPAGVARVICKLQLNLGILGPRLRAEAELQCTTMAALLRRAAVQMLDHDVEQRAGGVASEPFVHSVHNIQFHLNLPQAAFAELTDRARAAGMPRGEFVWSLLKGISAPALPADHEVAVQALRSSTDRVAALSTDLGEFLRLLTRASANREDLAPHQARIRSLTTDVRDHLRIASVLIDELRPYRRARR